MKKKFEIIEDGRLSKSEMQTLVGGLAFFAEECPGNGPDYSTGPCLPDDPTAYSMCYGGYTSCVKEKGLVSCQGTYTGPTGPNGCV